MILSDPCTVCGHEYVDRAGGVLGQPDPPGARSMTTAPVPDNDPIGLCPTHHAELRSDA